MASELLYDQFILFGDSLTQGSADQSRGFVFYAGLAHDYMRKLDVVNRGFSGYNTSQALLILPRIIPSPNVAKIRFLTIFFGANDACHPKWPSKQHVPLDQYKSNLEAIIKHPAVVAHSPRIILITPPPVDEHQFAIDSSFPDFNQRGRSAAYTKKYADACREVGKSLDVPVLDLWNIFMTRAGWKGRDTLPGSMEIAQNHMLKEALYDGLHLDAPAYKIFYDELKLLIENTWPDQVPEKLAPVFPLWEKAPGQVDL